ncbi:CLUMA_CG000105, isoform A [Clunio marinus]|uniref:CLUMA_CG000105, isoform A n=1 Tax=Clunio marinus TaxID=568069 RepID=A0A1J1HEL2_9DIPT|nr:CLUMA_CG000105, isoform A [Clunio marinus]
MNSLNTFKQFTSKFSFKNSVNVCLFSAESAEFPDVPGKFDDSIPALLICLLLSLSLSPSSDVQFVRALKLAATTKMSNWQHNPNWNNPPNQWNPNHPNWPGHGDHLPPQFPPGDPRNPHYPNYPGDHLPPQFPPGDPRNPHYPHYPGDHLPPQFPPGDPRNPHYPHDPNNPWPPHHIEEEATPYKATKK